MFTNYLRMALRHHLQNKLYAVINTTGLAIGVTCILLSVVYLKDERSYDDFHQHNPHLYRITTSQAKDGKIQTTGGTGQVQGPAFKAGVPEIRDYTRVMGGDIYGDFKGNDKVLQQQLLFVDANFFSVFSFPLLKGDPHTALNDIGSAVITESMALKYFNRIDVVGQLLTMDADPSARKLGKPLVITGVVKDPPRHSSIRFDILLPFAFLQLSFEDNSWDNQYLSTFIVLDPHASTSTVSRKLNRIYAAHAKSDGVTAPVSYGLQRITAIHLQPLYVTDGGREGGVINGSNPAFSYIFLGIALFILLMAGINFVNINLAGSLKRTKEVGVRKINGSSSFQIITQFLVESALLCGVAFLLALMLTWIVLPVFNQLAGKGILISEALDGALLFYNLLILAAIVILTGAYPAYVLSRFRAVQVLSQHPKVNGRSLPGRILVVIQFSLAVFLLLITLLFYRQMDYIRTKDLGYDPHLVVRSAISGERDLQQVQEQLKSELAKTPGIGVISFGGERGGTSTVLLKDKKISAVHRVIDQHYLEALGISLQEGRNFSERYATDNTSSVIVNEAFVKAAGLANPIGTQIRTDEYFDKEIRTITGVVKDFHYGSLRERIQPMVMIMSGWYGGTVWLKLEKSRQQEALAALAAAYKKVLPETSFRYSFLDELNAREYAQEQRWKKIIYTATLLSILICCSGLFGLVHIATHQRMKEIGIRRILGAGVTALVTLFSREFLQLVLLAIIITCPLAFSVMRHWLQQFAYRVEINGWIFMTAGCFALFIALITVGIQVVRAVLVNPVKSLRGE